MYGTLCQSKEIVRLNRLAESLADGARVSPLHVQVVVQIGQALIAGLQAPAPGDLHHLLTPLHEWLSLTGEPVRPECRTILESIAGSGKTSKLAAMLLQRKGGTNLAHRRRVLVQACHDRLNRARRWAERERMADARSQISRVLRVPPKACRGDRAGVGGAERGVGGTGRRCRGADDGDAGRVDGVGVVDGPGVDKDGTGLDDLLETFARDDGAGRVGGEFWQVGPAEAVQGDGDSMLQQEPGQALLIRRDNQVLDEERTIQMLGVHITLGFPSLEIGVDFAGDCKWTVQ